MFRALQGAVEFLLMAGQMDQAFDIAMGHNEMDTFARIVAASAKPVRPEPRSRTLLNVRYEGCCSCSCTPVSPNAHSPGLRQP